MIGCAIFAAVSGSSAATCATIGKMSLPELARRGYPEEMTIGSLAGAGTLGPADPALDHHDRLRREADVSIAQLFIAGVLPGIMLARLFSGYIASGRCCNPAPVPPPDATHDLRREALRVAAPDPGGAADRRRARLDLRRHRHGHRGRGVGVVGSLVLSAVQRSLDWRTFCESLMGATRLYCMIALILAGAAFLTLVDGLHRPAAAPRRMDRARSA